MKLRKTKLTAILMSALMAASTVSPLAYAEEDIIVDEYAVVETVEGGEEATEEAATVEVEEVEEQVTATPELQAQDTGAYTVIEDSIEFLYTVENYEVVNDSYTVKYQTEYVENGVPKYRDETATAYVKEGYPTAATCLEDGILVLQVKIQDVTYDSPDYHVEKALGHADEELKRQTIKEPTHYEDGLAHVWYKCTRCGYEHDDDVVLDAQEHTLGKEVYEPAHAVATPNIKVDANGDVVLGADGLPQLADPTMDGYYDIVKYCTKKDGYFEYVEEAVEILATEGVYAQITAQGGLAADVNLVTDKMYYFPSKELPLDNDSIELAHCDEPGWYIISYFQKSGKRISDEKIVVTPHHMPVEKIVEFKTKDDADQCVVTYSATDDTYTVYNKSCYLPVEYYEVLHCEADGCREPLCTTDASLIAENSAVAHTDLKVLSKEAKTAEPNGDHVIDTPTKQAIAAAVAAGATFEDLETIVKNNKYVKVSDDTSTCTEDGTAKVTYLCKVCTKVVKEETVDVVAKGHIVLAPTRENYKAPTCTAAGSYDAVTYCKRCNEVIREVRNIEIPRLRHTNEDDVQGNTYTDDTDDSNIAKDVKFELVGDKFVDDNGSVLKKATGAWLGTNEIGSYEDEFCLSVRAYTLCENGCGHKVYLDQRDVEIVLESVQKQDAKGQNGYIIVSAEYTNDNNKTFKSGAFAAVPYFSSMNSYEGRIDKDPVPPISGLHEDEDGVWRYYVNGEVLDYTGIVNYAGDEFLVVDGALETKANGLVLPFDGGKWYMMSNGHIERNFTGVTVYDGKFFYVTNGELDETVKGFVPYNGAMFLFWDGYLRDEANGLWQNPEDGKWYFLSAGQLQSHFTGVTTYDGAFFYLRAGVLAEEYNGTVTYDGVVFNVVNGMLTTPVA